jgi:hypothetical protein
MSCLSFILNKTASVYTVDRTATTSSGQPTEVLTLARTIKVYFSPNVRNIYKLFDSGQIKVGEYSCFSVKTISLGEIVEIDSEKYMVTGVAETAFKKHVYGYVSYLERYRH